MTTDTIFSLRSGEFSVLVISVNKACFVELLCTGVSFFAVALVGLGWFLTGEDKDAKESVCSCCLYFFVLLLLLRRFLEPECFFWEIPVPFHFFLPLGIKHLGVNCYCFSLFLMEVIFC